MTKASELRTKLIRDIEDMVEEALPNHLHEQDFIFTQLHGNSKARLLYERQEDERTYRKNNYKSRETARQNEVNSTQASKRLGTNQIQ